MAKFYSCPHCGSNLDLNERCDCQDEVKKRSIRLRNEPNNRFSLKETNGKKKIFLPLTKIKEISNEKDFTKNCPILDSFILVVAYLVMACAIGGYGKRL